VPVQCPFCERVLDEKGVLAHIRYGHPSEYLQEGYKLVDSKGKFKKEFLRNEDVNKSEVLLTESPNLSTKDKKKKPEFVNKVVNKNDEGLLTKSVNKQEITKEDLLMGKKKKEATTQAPEETYNCANCTAPIKKGQENCPKCGIELDWSGV
jgi:hypothetical protein